ncbi:TLD-domain-containing protein [Cladochytrium replicatum]|nr:TLD-domain-containing protein [Cladochytrium replicatum]
MGNSQSSGDTIAANRPDPIEQLPAECIRSFEQLCQDEWHLEPSDPLSEETFRTRFPTVNDGGYLSLLYRIFCWISCADSLTPRKLLTALAQIHIAARSTSESSPLSTIFPNTIASISADEFLTTLLQAAFQSFCLLSSATTHPSLDPAPLAFIESLVAQINAFDAPASSPLEKVDAWCAHGAPAIWSSIWAVLFLRFFGATSPLRVPGAARTAPTHGATTLLNDERRWLLALYLERAMSMEKKEREAKAARSSDGAEEQLEVSWDLLYRGSEHGFSFNRFEYHCGNYSGPTVVLLECRQRDKDSSEPLILGAFVKTPWKKSKSFWGEGGALFELSPHPENYPPLQAPNPTGTTSGYCMFNPEKKVLGFGGDQFRFQISTDFETGWYRSFATTRQSVYSSSRTRGPFETDFELLEIEVFGLGGAKAKKSQADYRRFEAKDAEKRANVNVSGDAETARMVLALAGLLPSENVDRG